MHVYYRKDVGAASLPIPGSQDIILSSSHMINRQTRIRALILLSLISQPTANKWTYVQRCKVTKKD